MTFVPSARIRDLEHTITVTEDKRRSIIDEAGDSVMTPSQMANFDRLTEEIANLKCDLERSIEAQKASMASAKPVDVEARKSAFNASKPGAKTFATIKSTQSLEDGLGFARVARCLALSHIHHESPAQIAKSIYPDDDRTLHAVSKAAVPAANTGSTTWAGNLITDGGTPFADFVEWLRPRTVVGQVQDRLRVLPFDTPVLVQGSGGVGKWVKEGNAKPLTQWTYTRAKLAPLKVAAIAAATKETLNRASLAADVLLRDELARAVGACIDSTFIDPTVAAVADTSPGSILNGVTELVLSGGSTVADIRSDIATYLTTFAGNNLSLQNAFWIMPERIAIALSLIANEVGAQAFPGITPNGGTFAGIPVFVTGYAPTTSAGSVVALVKGDEIFLGDEGGVQVSMSDQASLVMDDSPTENSTTPTAAQVVSMFQTNSVAFLVERFINWQRRRAQAVAWAHVGWNANGE